MSFFDISILIVAVALLGILMVPSIRNNRWWQATVTPLASIIGSGFLVIAPLLAKVAGSSAIIAMGIIVIAAWVIGSVIRFNIIHSEPIEAEGSGSLSYKAAVRVSNMALTVAYVISVAFYIRLMASFLLSMTPFTASYYADWLSTLVLAGIGIIGWLRGLKGLEAVETISVSVKLSIIAALLFGLAYHNFSTGKWMADLVADDVDSLTRLRMLAGMLLVVQGFETSRYLGDEYGPVLRKSTMAAAQILSAVIYIVFVALVVPILVFLPEGKATETAIIGLTGHVATILPFMLIVAAFMSQLSAAIADTVGAGGLVSQETAKRIPQRASYPALVALSIALIWLFNIFEVISIASRAFAFYYMMQAIIAFVVVTKVQSGSKKLLAQSGFAIVALILALVVVFALPVE